MRTGECIAVIKIRTCEVDVCGRAAALTKKKNQGTPYNQNLISVLLVEDQLFH